MGFCLPGFNRSIYVTAADIYCIDQNRVEITQVLDIGSLDPLHRHIVGSAGLRSGSSWKTICLACQTFLPDRSQQFPRYHPSLYFSSGPCSGIPGAPLGTELPTPPSPIPGCLGGPGKEMDKMDRIWHGRICNNGCDWHQSYWEMGLKSKYYRQTVGNKCEQMCEWTLKQ